MDVIKATAALPRGARKLGRASLTAWMALLACCVGLTIWVLLDLLHQDAIEQVVATEWQEEFAHDAVKQRTRIRHAVATFHETAEYLAGAYAMQRYLERWNRRGNLDAPAALRNWQPDWLARTTSLDGTIRIAYAVVFGKQRASLAVYRMEDKIPPLVLTTPDPELVQAVSIQPQVIVHAKTPYLLSAAPVKRDDGEVAGTIMIAAAIDNRFLAGILDKDSERTVTGLLLGEERKPVALSAPRLAGTLASRGVIPSDRFAPIANELLMESANGLQLRYALWFDKDYVSQVGEPYLLSVRHQRSLVIGIFALLIIGIVAWISARIGKIHRKVENYARRLGITLSTASAGDQIDRLKINLERMSEEVIAETYALEYQAQHDNLTNLPNRSLLFDRLESALQSCQDDGEPLALCIMDLDQFKEVNDTLGHHIGDRLLQEVGRRLVSVLRRTDTVSRLGGDEFAVLLPGADYQRSKAICRKIMAALERPIKIENLRLRAGISIGVALCPDHGQDGNLLLQHADVAMYEAKRAQLGFSFYMAERDEHSISRLGLAGELSDAISGNQLMLEYQPMVDMKTGKIFCVEALVRWVHPEYGCVAPEDFISTAEQTGVIRPLTLWVIDQALGQSRSWQRAGIDLQISINLSVRSLADRKLPDQVQKLVDKHQVDPKRVILEITESAIMSDPLTARRVMRRLSNMGFHLSIDDFGTGYSSLSYLKQLPVDEIKIDKSFVTQMDREENDAVIVRATIDLAHNLGLKVVAEGVESTDVWDLLEMLGCDTAQGFFIRKPVGPHELASWIRSKEWDDARWVKPLGAAG